MKQEPVRSRSSRRRRIAHPVLPKPVGDGCKTTMTVERIFHPNEEALLDALTFLVLRRRNR